MDLMIHGKRALVTGASVNLISSIETILIHNSNREWLIQIGVAPTLSDQLRYAIGYLAPTENPLGPLIFTVGCGYETRECQAPLSGDSRRLEWWVLPNTAQRMA
jgi:hypothetical protein